MGAEDVKKEEIHLIGLGDEQDQKNYLEKLQKLKNHLKRDIALLERNIFSKNLPLSDSLPRETNVSEEGLIGKEIDLPDDTSIISNLTVEGLLPVKNDLFKSQITRELKFLTELLSSESDVNEVYFQRQTPLHIAIKNEWIDLVRSLIEKGANVNITGRRGKTPLHGATETNRLEITQLLIKEGANLDAIDNLGNTPLHYLTKSQNETSAKIAQVLIDNGADILLPNRQGKTPLDIAFIEEVNDSFSSDLDGLVQSTNTNITLSYALKRFEDEDKIIDIVKGGANLNIENVETGNTALHTAIMKNKTRVSLALIKVGANVNTINQNGITPLGMAIKYKNTKVISALKKRRAKTTLSGSNIFAKGDKISAHRKQLSL